MKLHITFEIDAGVYSPTCSVEPKAIAEAIAKTLQQFQENGAPIGVGWNNNDFQFEVMLENITVLNADEMEN